jgi:hypothetical protein
MTTIALEDHELSLADYSACELRLHDLGALLRPAGEVYAAPDGRQRARFTAPAVEFHEEHTSAADVEQALGAYGFRKKSP